MYIWDEVRFAVKSRGFKLFERSSMLPVLGESIQGGVMGGKSETQWLREHVKTGKARSMFWNN